MNVPKKTKLNESNQFKYTDFLLLVEFKFLMTILLSVFAFTRYAMMPDRIHELCLYAMLFSTMGDLCMMNYKGIPAVTFKGKQFYSGMLFFVFAHIFYRQMFKTVLVASVFVAIGEVIGLVFLFAFFVIIDLCNLRKNSPIFNVSTVLYTCVIFSNLAAAINCAYYLNGKYILTLIGVVSFIISDFFLLIRETKQNTAIIRKMIWIFYPLAQILIIANV